MSSAGAKAALEGYRKQALYTLACILHEDVNEMVFQPEGMEDLAVYRGQQPLRIVQVKAHTDNLTLSCFSPEKPKSFFHRVASDLAAHRNLSIEVISFGPIGAEISGAWSGEERHRASVRAKLRNHNFSDAKVDTLFTYLKWQKVDEDLLQKQVFDFLGNSAVGGDPECAFNLLTVWIYSAAEKKQRITYTDLITKINAIGRYVAERCAHHQEWGSSITPIEDIVNDSSRHQLLADEFYNGISTRYSHILAGFDVPRYDKLNAIDQAFSTEVRTVIVHGASGQGKTTLALRYFHDYVPEKWRFSIRYLQDKAQISRVANALAGHLNAVNAPLYLHLDVSPRDHEWPELVKNLLDQKNIRILITIREEDLARTTISDVELGFPKTIALHFNRAEAITIYERLLQQGSTAPFPSFDNAWTRFGGTGPLLEFVYFITQAETLKERLCNQVLQKREEVRTGQFSPEEFTFLRVCAVASAFEARIDAASLATELKLKNPVRTLQLLEDEYLLRSSHNNRYVEALHPIRSEILAEEIVDPIFEPWRAAATLAINHMPEPDLEAFLLYSFVRQMDDTDSLVGAINQYFPKTWSGVAAIMRALLWLGTKEYVETNIAVITEAQRLFTHAWYMALKFDASGISSDGDADILDAFKDLGFMGTETMANLRLKQTDRSSIFNRLTQWVDGKGYVPSFHENALDWAGFAEAHFWIRYLNLKTAMLGSIESLDMTWPLEHLSSRGLGEVILSLSYSPDATYKQIIDPFRRRIQERFRFETRTIALEETDEITRAHYVVPMETPASSSDEDAQKASGNWLETETIKLLYLLRLYMPNRKAYGVQGYGHNLRYVPMPFDPTSKGPVESRYLLPEWPLRINAIFRHLGDLHFRSSTWQEYAERVVQIREQIVVALNTLAKALTAYFAGNRPDILSRKLPQEIWLRCGQAVNEYLVLPKTAVDEWGLVGEGGGAFANESAMTTRKDRSISLVLKAYQPYLKAKSEYFSSLGNFFNQSILPLVISSNIGRMKTQTEREGYLKHVLALGYKQGSDRLSLHNLGDAWKALVGFQNSCYGLLSAFVDKERLHKLETQENKIFPVSWALWYHFVNYPETRWNSADIRAFTALERAQNILRDKLERGLTRMSSSDVHCSIHSDTLPWEGRPGLWVFLNADNGLAIFEGFAKLLQALEEAFAPMEIGSLEHYVLDHRWPHIVIVPFIAGEYWGNGVWHISSCLFWGGEKILDSEKMWRFMPKEVEVGTLEQLGIESGRWSIPGKIQLLQQAASELLVYVDHLSDLRKAPDDLDDIGMAIFQKHVRAKAQEASGALSRIVGQVQVLLDDVNSGVVDSSPHINHIRELLIDIWKCVMPEGHVKDNFEITLSACDSWAEKLLEGLGHMTALNYFYPRE